MNISLLKSSFAIKFVTLSNLFYLFFSIEQGEYERFGNNRYSHGHRFSGGFCGLGSIRLS